MPIPGTGWHSPRVFASAEMVIENNAVGITLTPQNAFLLVSTGWVEGDATAQGLVVDPAASHLEIVTKGRYLLLVTVTYDVSAGNNTFEFQIFLNGVGLTNSLHVERTVASTAPDTVTISGLQDLDVGDVLDLRAACVSANGITITVLNANFLLLFVG